MNNKTFFLIKSTTATLNQAQQIKFQLTQAFDNNLSMITFASSSNQKKSKGTISILRSPHVNKNSQEHFHKVFYIYTYYYLYHEHLINKNNRKTNNAFKEIIDQIKQLFEPSVSLRFEILDYTIPFSTRF